MCSEKPRENQFVRLQNLRGQGRKKVRDEDKVNKWNPSSLSEHTVQKLFQESECRLSLDALFTSRLRLMHYVSAKIWVYQGMSLSKQNIFILTTEMKGF